MFTKTLAVTSLLVCAEIASFAVASPITFANISNGTYNDFGVQRARGTAHIYGDLDGDGNQDLLASVQYRVRETWLATTATLPNYVDTPDQAFTQLDPNDASGGTLRTSLSLVSPGGDLFLRNRVEYTISSLQQGGPMTTIGSFTINDPGNSILQANVNINYGTGQVLSLTLTSLITPEYQRLGADLREIASGQLDSRVHVRSIAPIVAGLSSEYNVLSIQGDLVPGPGVLVLVACGGVAVVRRRRRTE